MSILIVNDTTSNDVSYTLEGVPASGSGTVVAQGTLGAAGPNNSAVYNPPSSGGYQNYRLSFPNVASSGTPSVTLVNQSEGRLAMTAAADLSNLPHVNPCGPGPAPVSGLQIVTATPGTFRYSVYGNAPVGSGRTIVASGVVSSGSTASVPPSQLAGYDYFDVVLNGASGFSTRTTVQQKTRITFAAVESSFAVKPAPMIGSGTATPPCS